MHSLALLDPTLKTREWIRGQVHQRLVTSNIYDHVHFSKSGTRSSAAMKMSHNHSMKNSLRHSYFNQSLWNSLPPINLDLSVVSAKDYLRNYLFDQFLAPPIIVGAWSMAVTLWQQFEYYYYLLNFCSNSSCSFHFFMPLCKMYPQLSSTPFLSSFNLY